MIFHRYFISIIAILFFSVCAGAQDTGFVYRDTSIVSVDSVETNAVNMGTEEASDDGESDSFVPDTSLVNNQLTIAPDSVKTLKNIRGLAYAKNLDSLLIEYQKRRIKESQSVSEPSWLESFFMSPITKYFFWILAVVFIVFILAKLFFTEGFFQRSYAKSAVKVLTEESESLSHTADYAKLITQAISQKNYRLAIRYHYLQSLQKLASKGLIQFAPDKTNYEYVQELAGKTYKKEFASLTLNYEYAWYGEFEINEPAFESIQQKFKQFNTVL